ncbi:MAG TPA: STAS domain-containing protein, partial [Acidimicrobiia bacterium]|nr:STAS domain-containing protein [Acidimicrobiia bacterium]
IAGMGYLRSPKPVPAAKARNIVDEQANPPVAGPDLVVTTDKQGARVVLSISGELDAYTAPGLEDQIARLMTEGTSDIVLDLSQTEFLDSSGLRAILTAQRKLTEQHGKLTLRAPSEPVTRLLEITGLTDNFATDG